MNYIDIDERFKNKKLAPDDFYAVIEISKGSKNKYEYDHDTGLLNLDRILDSLLLSSTQGRNSTVLPPITSTSGL